MIRALGYPAARDAADQNGPGRAQPESDQRWTVQTMDLVIEDLPGGIKLAKLAGRLDIPGAAKIDLPWNVLIGNNLKVVVDLEAVSFMASMGIRSIILGAKKVTSRGGRMVLLKPNPDVHKVLTETGTDAIVPIVDSLDAAVAAVA